MQQLLLSHVVSISAQRDRTKINEALVGALDALFHPHSLTIFHVFPGKRRTMVFACAGIGRSGNYVRNAYLLDASHCHAIDLDPVLVRVQAEKKTVEVVLPDETRRLVFPVFSLSRLIYLIDITVHWHLSPQRHEYLAGLIEYFSNHVALLEYGEADTLTGLPNRKTFDKHLFEVLGKATVDDAAGQHEAPRRRKGASDSRNWLAVCDIDHFKKVNDTHGHLIGDEVLVMFANLMRDTFRFDDQLFRFGGEEFVVVLQPMPRAAVQPTVERFRRAVENHVFSRVGQVTASIGYSQLLTRDTPPDVIDRADEALYYVKQNGRNGIACYEDLVGSGKLVAMSSRTGDIELF
jgi:diguanylate cyclase (GGDEF)-like protein